MIFKSYAFGLQKNSFCRLKAMFLESESIAFEK